MNAPESRDIGASERTNGRRVLCFGGFTLDLERRGLYRNGERIRLTAKPIETLIFLVENRGCVIEKQQLLDAVWKDTFVTEDTLVHAIREIRRALEDDKGDPRFVQTVPRQGYRFVGRVSEEPSQALASTPNHSTMSCGAPGLCSAADTGAYSVRSEHSRAVPAALNKFPAKRRYLAASSIGLVALVLASWPWWRSWFLNAPKPPTVRVIPGSGRNASLSPDGRMIAFVKPVNDVPQLFVQNLAHGDPVQITFGDLHSDRPRWSPGNDQIAFTRGCHALGAGVAHGAESIWSVAPLGGSHNKLIDEGRSPNWSSDGSRLVYERDDEIWTASADGGSQQRVEGVPPVALLLADRMPAFSPDGSLIAFFQPESGPWGDIWVIASVGGEPRRLTFDVCEASSPIWTPDGRYVVFSSERTGSRTLWRAPASGGEPKPVLVSAGEDTDPDISTDGRRLVFTTTRNQYLLTTFDPATGKSKGIRELSNHFVCPSFSPRGDRIAFSSDEAASGIHIYTVDASGGNLTQITGGNGERNVFPQWCADGSRLYFYQTRPSTSFRKISVSGGQSVEVAPGWAWETQNGARVDSRGTHILYTRTQNGVPALTLIRRENGDEIDVDLPLYDARWSPDDEFVVGTDLRSSNPPEGDILLWGVNAGPRIKLTRGYAPVWSRDGSRIYFLRTGKLADGAELWSISRDGLDERRIGELRPMHPTAHFYDVSPTGQVVFVQLKPSKQQLGILELTLQ